MTDNRPDPLPFVKTARWLEPAEMLKLALASMTRAQARDMMAMLDGFRELMAAEWSPVGKRESAGRLSHIALTMPAQNIALIADPRLGPAADVLDRLTERGCVLNSFKRDGATMLVAAVPLALMHDLARVWKGEKVEGIRSSMEVMAVEIGRGFSSGSVPQL